MAGIEGVENDQQNDTEQRRNPEECADENSGESTENTADEDIEPMQVDSPPSELSGQSSDEPSTPPSDCDDPPMETLTAPIINKNTTLGDNADSKDDDIKTVSNDGKEVVMIQDTGFTVQVQSPNAEPFDLPVSSMELVQEIHQVLMDREDTCHRTCFSLQVDGVTMDNFAELKSIENLNEKSLIKVIEEPYTVREARIHVRHLRDLLKSVDNADSYNGVDCNSLSFLNVVTDGDILDKKKAKPDSMDCTPPDYIMPGSKERPLLPLHPTIKDGKVPACLKVLTYSGWNPPPGNRRMHGDLLYLNIVTLEDKRYYITSSTRGFYVNLSTEDEFNPKAAPQKYLSHSLIDLLNQVSPGFKKNFAVLLKKRSQKNPFERVPTPYQVYSWMSPHMDHPVDAIRAEDAFSSRLGYEEHIPGQTRDWNEEIQTTKELPRKTLPERLIRERAIFKVHSDFVVAATRGATAVIDGNIMAINPGEDSKMQMFIWNGIFFSLGFDVKDHYKEFGGDYAAYAAPASDLQGVKAYWQLDLEGLYTLGTVVVDYRGYRVTAQSIIPGILEREQEQSVVYGSVDFGKTVVTDEKYKELLQKSAVGLKVCPHKVINSKDEEIELLSSVECKGIVGNDRRYYILDLLRTFPPDVNFLDVSPEEVGAEARKQGFPHPHRHKMVCLRQELIEAFVEERYLQFVKHAAFQFQQLRLQKQTAAANEAAEKSQSKETTPETLVNGTESNETKPIKTEETKPATTEEKSNLNETQSGTNKNETSTEKTDALPTDEAKKIVESLAGSGEAREIVTKAAKFVGSLSDTEFVLTFNPDLHQPYVKHVDPESEQFERQKKLVRDAAEFVLTNQIPSFIRDCLEHTSSPIDGYTLSESLHHSGINIRYLGKVTEMLAKYPDLSYVYSIAVMEMVCRATKHLFQPYMHGVEMMSVSSAVSHFLNCLLGSCPTPHAQVAADELQSRTSRKKNKKKQKYTQSSDGTEWLQETPKSLWKKIAQEVYEYYDYKVDSDSVDTLIEKYNLQKVSILRACCHKLGIQIVLRDYHFDSKNKQPFNDEDIINIFPVVKNLHPRASDAYSFFQTGQQKIQQGLLREGYDLISEALNLLNNVYGPIHPEIAACCRLLARLNYIMGDYPEALAYQQKAVLMSERVLGVDHPNTITEYAHLALYSFSNTRISEALHLMYRARYLALLCFGENHPEVALFDSNIGLILHAVGEYELSLRFLDKALELNTKFFGAKSLKVAMSFHLVARAHSCRGDFRTALQNEKEAYAIYKTKLGEEHDRTKESSECLKHLTQQAVVFQKKMNEISKGEKSVSFPPIQIATPSLMNVLETLNVINGIVFLHIRPEDIEKFKLDMSQHAKQRKEIENGEQADPSDSANKQNGDSSSKENSPKISTPKESLSKENSPKLDTKVGDNNANLKKVTTSDITDNSTNELITQVEKDSGHIEIQAGRNVKPHAANQVQTNAQLLPGAAKKSKTCRQLQYPEQIPAAKKSKTCRQLQYSKQIPDMKNVTDGRKRLPQRRIVTRQTALLLHVKFFGVKSLKVAMPFHLVARAHSCRGDFRTALQNEKEAYAIYKTQLGEEHDRTKESSECLKHLTQQAVVFQKKMNEISKGEKSVSFPPIQIATPSLMNVLETLNVINGIVFLHIRPEDIEKFKLDMSQHAKQRMEIENGEQADPSDSANKQNGDSSSKENSPKISTPKESLSKENSPKLDTKVGDNNANLKKVMTSDITDQ
ncbi:unnamed protein product [Owenia fusiformis]|uniref:Clustered mitochondria protein homolog n=1 Tax=Owenia fusiformis TaxID=6347 RepID=A0A8J1YAI8_OWEFU|nr:unnamed protein product [Owenia fusiformis]